MSMLGVRKGVGLEAKVELDRGKLYWRSFKIRHGVTARTSVYTLHCWHTLPERAQRPKSRSRSFLARQNQPLKLVPSIVVASS